MLPAPDFVSAGWAPGVEMPFCPADGFSCPDGVVDVIVCGESLAELPATTMLRLLLDCRRVLRPEGVIRVVMPSQQRQVTSAGVVPVAKEDWLRFASLVGLEATTSAPIDAHCRAVMADLAPVNAGSIGFDFTKRDRQVAGDPLVSILIPAYSARFFAACLDSALAQTYANVEIVVCDDSPDSAIEAIVRAR